MGETSKAWFRREMAGWFEKYIKLPGLDVGAGNDPVHPKFDVWDWKDGVERNAQTLNGIHDESYETVYSSHVLEHLDDPVEAIRNWWRVLKPGGHLIVVVPHMTLYEKREHLPSRWNPEHKTFWLPSSEKLPHIRCLDNVVRSGIFGTDNLSQEQLAQYSEMRKYFDIADEGYDYSLPPDVHGVGEYSIEIIVRKP